MTALIWKITGIECYASHGIYSNVVKRVTWSIEASEINFLGTPILSTYTGSWDLPVDALVDFIEYSSLDEPQILNWVKTSMGPDTVSKYNNIVIDTLAQSVGQDSVVATELPWLN